MNILKTIVKPIVKKAGKYQARIKLSQLKNINNSAADKMARALEDTLDNRLDSEETKWVNKIEEVRRTLNNSLMEISTIDYGAGNAHSKRTQKEMYQGVVTTTTVSRASKASKPYFWSLLLFKLIREFRPSTCIELGTCVGISAAYQASALKINKQGTFVTMEGASTLASLAAKKLKELGLDNATVVSGRFQDNLDKILNQYKTIDYAFIDGHHEEKATLDYFDQIIPFLTPKSIIVFDDIAWSDGMRCAWNKIEQSDIVKISLDLRTIGICILDDNIKEKHHCKLPMI